MLDILMISHNRLEYLKKAVKGVMRQTLKDWRLTIWDNFSDAKTQDWLREQDFDSRVQVILGDKNESLARVTSEVFLQSRAKYVGKVDADTIIPPWWAERLMNAHEKWHFGFIGGFHFHYEDLNGIKPIINIHNGIAIWPKHHIGGCAFVIRRADFTGYEGEGVMGLSEYQGEFQARGLVNGYLWDPILWVEHMEDGRSPYCIKTPEYEDYKLATRGLTIAQYTAGIPNKNYLNENTL